MVATVGSIDVTLRLLGADTFQARMRDSGSVSEQTGARVKRAMDGIAGSTDRVARAADGLDRSNGAMNALAFSALRAETSVLALNKAFLLLGTAVGGLAGGVALNAFKNYADTATSIQNRLAAVIPGQRERAQIDQQIFDTAQRTRTSYEATANIFSRMTLSAGTLGASQSQILKVVETTQKALQAGGATAAESASIATQLTQALGSGRLQGDELRSIAENSPVLIQAIAKEFGVAVGALKDMGSEGQLTSERVFKAILNAGQEVDDVFARTTPTIAAGIVQIDNALTRYIGNVDKSLGVTKALTGGLQFVAQNFTTIGDSAALAVAALAGPLGARLLAGAGGRVAAPFRAARADAASGLTDATARAEAARAAREAAQVGLREAEGSLKAFESQPRFRQATGDVQRAYERQAQTVDKLRDAATKTAERETAALMKRADAEQVVAQISQASTNRVQAAKETLARREGALNDILARRPALEQAAAQAGANITRRQQGTYYDALYKVVDQRQKLAEANATITLTRRNIEALDEAMARERSRPTASNFIPIAMQRRQAETDRLPGLISQRDDIGRVLNERENALVAVERKLGDAQVSEREKAQRRLADLDNQASKARLSVAGAAEKVSAAEIKANDSLIASAEKRARVQADLDAKAIAAAAQRRAAEQAYAEAQTRLGGLAGQVGPSAAAQRAQVVEQVARAQSVLNTAYFAEQEALGRTAEAAGRTSTAKVALAGAARAATATVGGLVNMLGGPLGAALTAASVGLIGYELYQARAAARAEEHSKALEQLADRMREVRAQSQRNEARSDRDIVGDRAILGQASKAVRDRRDALLSAYDRASSLDTSNAYRGDGVFGASTLDQAAQNLGVNIASVVTQLRTLPPASQEAATAGNELVRVLIEAAQITPQGFTRIADEAAKMGGEFGTAAQKVRDAAAALQEAAAAGGALRNRKAVYDISDEEVTNLRADRLIDQATSLGRDVADALSMGMNDRIQTGEELTASLLSQGEKAKAAFQSALSGIDTETLNNALQAVGSSLETVKSNLDGTKIASGEAGAASIAFAQALTLIQSNQPDLAATIAQINSVTNAYRQMIGLQAVAVQGALTTEQKAAAEAKQREQSLKSFEDRLQRADKTPAGRQVRIRRDLPGLTDAEVSRLDAAENPARAGRKAAKSKEQKDADTLAKKLEELDQDAGVAVLNDFDQKTVRFAQSAKVASEQIQAFIAAAKSGDMSNVPPVLQQIYDKMKLLEGVKLAQKTLDELFPARKLARELEELRAAANASPEIARNIGAIEERIRERNAPEWASGISNGVTNMAKSVVAGTATAADALTTFKTRIMNLALDAAFKPIERMLTGGLGSLAGAGSGVNFGDIVGFFTGSSSPLPSYADGTILSGPGTGTSDSMLARVSNGEAIIPARVVAQNRSLVQAMIADRLPRFAEGAIIDTFGARQQPRLASVPSIAASPSPLGDSRPVFETTIINNAPVQIERREVPDGRGGRRQEVIINEMVATAQGSPQVRQAQAMPRVGSR